MLDVIANENQENNISKTIQMDKITKDIIILLSLIILFNYHGNSQVNWKYIKNKSNFDNEAFTYGYSAAADVVTGKNIFAGAYVDFKTDLKQLITIVDNKGNVLKDSIFDILGHGAFYVQAIPNSNHFFTLSAKSVSLEVLKTIYDYDLNVINEEIIFDDNSGNINLFSYNQSVLKNGNILISSNQFRGHQYIILSPNGDLVKKGIIEAKFETIALIEGYDSSIFYLIGENLIELDSNLMINKALKEGLIINPEFYGSHAVKFNTGYILKEKLQVTLFDNNFNQIKTVVIDEETENYECFPTGTNSIIQKDSLILTCHTRFDKKDSCYYIVIQKYDNNLIKIGQSIITDELYCFTISNMKLSSTGDLLLTGFGPERKGEESKYYGLLMQFNPDIITTNVKEEVFDLKNNKPFPNPSFGPFIIDLENAENPELLMYDIFGRLIFNTKELVNGLNTMDLSNIKSGIFYFKIFDNEKLISKGKWVKI